MALSATAQDILKDPMTYLDVEHNEKKPIDPKNIWTVKSITTMSEEEYITALLSIRNLSSKRGLYEGKELIHESIANYSNQILSRFQSVNQLSHHLKGIYGCELPKKFRDYFHRAVQEEPSQEEPSQEEPSQEEPSQEEPSQEENLTLTLGGVSFTLSNGASLNIGELEIKSLDFKGLRSVTIQKVAEGKIYGLNLES